MAKSLTAEQVAALPDGARLVVTLAGWCAQRQTVIGELRHGGGGSSMVAPNEMALFRDGFLVAILNPGDGFDEDFVAIAEG